MTHFKSRVGALPSFSDEELARLTMPTLLILGEQDALFASDKIAARLQKLLPHLTVHLLPDKGHVLHGTYDIVNWLFESSATAGGELVELDNLVG